jgi:flagellar FliJ protein
MSDQLDIVLRLAKERQEAAAQALGQAQAQLADVLSQMQQILDYQADYRAKARGEQSHSLAASQLVEARRFLTEINAIVNAQQSRVAQVEAAVNQRQQVWAEAARYTQAIEKLAAERRRTHAQAQEKRQQQQIDDLYGQRGFIDP